MRRIILLSLLPVLVSACSSPASLLDAGNACYIRGDYEGSLTHFRAARRKDPTLPEIEEKIRLAEVRLFLQRGDQAAHGRRWEAAERAYQEVRRLDPGNEEIAERLRRVASGRANQHFQRGQELSLAGNPFDAMTEFEQALASQPDHPRAAQALELARAQVEDQKRKAELAFQEGERAQAAGRLEEAAQHFARALDLNRYHPGANRELAEVKSRIERARNAARAETLVDEGNRAFDRGDWRTAFERFEEASRLSEDRERFRVRHETARDQLAAAIEAEARAIERERRLEEALSRYRSIAAFHPRYRDLDSRCREVEAAIARADHLHRLAVEAEERRELDKARSFYEQSVAICSNSRGGEERLSRVNASLHALEGRYRKVLEAQQRERFHDALSHAREIRKQCVGYRDIDQRLPGLESEVDYADAGAHEAKQDYEQAIRCLERCAQRTPGFRDVPERLRRFRERRAQRSPGGSTSSPDHSR